MIKGFLSTSKKAKQTFSLLFWCVNGVCFFVPLLHQYPEVYRPCCFLCIVWLGSISEDVHSVGEIDC
jgi:hypothetical protein